MKLWEALALIVLIWAALYLPFLGSGELRGEEARRILPARTMLENGDWIVPRVGGELYSRKPPFINWSIAASFAATGVQNEWTARLPSVLFLLLLALTTVLSLRHRLGVRGAFAAGLVAISYVAILDKGHTAGIDPMYVAQTGMAWVLFLGWWDRGRPWLAYTIPWTLLGLGLLTKGPLHLLFFYLAVGLTLFFAKRRIELVKPPHFVGLALMLAVFIPWMQAHLARTESKGESGGVWLEQLTGRLQYQSIDWGGWISHPFEMVLNFMPWTVLLVAALWWTREQWGKLDYEKDRWSAAMRGSRWALMAGVALLCLTPEGLPRYVMPLYPIAAIVVIDGWQRLEGKRRVWLETGWAKVNAWGALALGIAAIVAGVAVPLTTPYLSHWLGLVAGALSAGLLWTIHSSFPRQLLVRSTLIMAVAGSLVLFFGAAIEKKQALFRPLAVELNEAVQDDDLPLVFFDPGHLRFLFYVHRPYEEIARASQLPKKNCYFFIQPEDLQKEKLQRYLAEFEHRELGRYHWEDRDFVLFRLTPLQP